MNAHTVGVMTYLVCFLVCAATDPIRVTSRLGAVIRPLPLDCECLLGLRVHVYLTVCTVGVRKGRY